MVGWGNRAFCCSGVQQVPLSACPCALAVGPGSYCPCSPSGCTFWGKRPWSRTRKILWQLGMVLGAPMVISLVAGIAVPVIIIGLPIYTGRKVLVLGSLYSRSALSLTAPGLRPGGHISEEPIHPSCFFSRCWARAGGAACHLASSASLSPAASSSLSLCPPS